MINRKKRHWLQSGDYTVLHSAKVQTEGTAACSFEGERNSFVVEASFSLLVLLSLRLKAWFVFFSKPQWVKNVKRTVCLILCVLNKNTGVLVCMSAQLVPVCADRCPFVDIWCPRASPLGRSFGFFTKREEVKNETVHLSHSSYTAKNAFTKLLMREIVWRVLQYIFLQVCDKVRHMH